MRLLKNIEIVRLSNEKTIASAFGRLLLSLFSFEKYFRSPAMQEFFKEKCEQNNLVKIAKVIISSLLSAKLLTFLVDVVFLINRKLATGIIVVILLLMFNVSDAQNLKLTLDISQDDSLHLSKLDEIQKTFKDSTELVKYFDGYITALHNFGHIESYIQHKTKSDTIWESQLKVGPLYNWINLNKGNLPEALLSKIGFREKLYTGKPFNFKQLRKLQEKVLEYSENNGHPFAEIGLKDIVLESGKVEATMNWDKNDLITIDSIRIQGNAAIKNEFLQNYFGLKPGDLYNESLLRKIKTKSKELPFIKEARSPNVLFSGNNATIDLFYKDVNASKFDLMLGVLPNENVEKGYSLSGEGQINLMNTLGAGEELDVQYRSYPGNATELKTKVVYPYLPFIPIGLDAKFNLYLRDSLYRNVNFYAGLMYNLKGANFVQVFYEIQNTDLTSVDENLIIRTKQLPNDLDVKNTYYGIAVHFENLDYRLNPTSGWVYKGSVALGNKKIPFNNVIAELSDPTDFDFKSLYDSISTKSLQFKSEYGVEKYWKLLDRSTIKTKIAGAVLRNFDDKDKAEIYDNERFFVGGNQLLRGFDEQSIFTDWYNVFTLEYRYLLGQNSNFFVFGDAAYLTNLKQDLAADQEFRAYGFGAGINFETEAGVFGMSYALGSQKGNPIEVRNGKIHFGYVNYF